VHDGRTDGRTDVREVLCQYRAVHCCATLTRGKNILRNELGGKTNDWDEDNARYTLPVFTDRVHKRRSTLAVNTGSVY